MAALSHGNLHPKRHSLLAAVLRTGIKETCCIVRAIRGRRMRWAGHKACKGQKRSTCRVLVGKPEGSSVLCNQDAEGRGILKLTLEKYNDSVRPGLVCLSLTWCPVNKVTNLLSSIRSRICLDYLRNCQLLKEDSAPQR
jgi:hypothetical protein